jgi:hypothetical protein
VAGRHPGCSCWLRAAAAAAGAGGRRALGFARVWGDGVFIIGAVAGGLDEEWLWWAGSGEKVGLGWADLSGLPVVLFGKSPCHVSHLPSKSDFSPSSAKLGI